jgi:hypothetical protein
LAHKLESFHRRIINVSNWIIATNEFVDLGKQTRPALHTGTMAKSSVTPNPSAKALTAEATTTQATANAKVPGCVYA